MIFNISACVLKLFVLSDRSVFIAWERGGCGKILGRSLDFMKNMGVGGGGAGREGSSHRCEPSRGGGRGWDHSLYWKRFRFGSQQSSQWSV